MARPRTRIPLDIFLNGRLVGRLQRQASGAIDFQYDASWLQWDHALPVSLSLPLREDRYSGDPVIAFFDNLLPDNEDVRRAIAGTAHAEGHDPYSLLSAIGRDCVGALQFLPEGVVPGAADSIAAEPLDDKRIAAILGDLKRSPLGISEESDFRVSLAGVQEKTALLHWKGAWHLPHGMTPTTHILKPQIGMLSNGIDLSQSVENEHLCMTIAHLLDLPVAETSIEDFGKRRVLVVERFDRRWTRDARLLRIPQEDCCQALGVPPHRKYEPEGGPGIRRIIELLGGSDEPELDRRLFFKAQIAFWLLGATDGHAKNFSIRLLPGGRFRLAPLYDVMSLQPNVDAGHVTRKHYKLAMAVGDNRHYGIDSIAPRHFLQTARRSGLAEAVVAEIFAELLESAPDALKDAQKRLPPRFPKQLVASIANGFTSRLRLLETMTGKESAS